MDKYSKNCAQRLSITIRLNQIFLWLGNFFLFISLNQLILSLLDASLLPRLLHSMEEEFWQQKKTEYRESNILAKSNKELKWIGVWKWFNFFSPLFSLCSNEWRLLTFFCCYFLHKKIILFDAQSHKFCELSNAAPYKGFFLLTLSLYWVNSKFIFKTHSVFSLLKFVIDICYGNKYTKKN